MEEQEKFFKIYEKSYRYPNIFFVSINGLKDCKKAFKIPKELKHREGNCFCLKDAESDWKTENHYYFIPSLKCFLNVINGKRIKAEHASYIDLINIMINTIKEV